MSKAGASIELGACPKCHGNFDAVECLPISLDCGHTTCQSCLLLLSKDKLPCPVDNKDEITLFMSHLPVNVALLTALRGGVDISPSVEVIAPNQRQSYMHCTDILVKLAKLVTSTKPAGRADVSQSTFQKEMSSCAYLNSSGHVTLSRPMQKKIVSLISCQLATEAGRGRMGRCVKSLGERCITELILEHQDSHQLSGILWGAVRSRGCQFLGPAMQEEVIRLILMALEDGSALSRKVLVLFVVQRLHEKYPQASKTAIGHVVQLLYRASCFKVMKRENESSLMQLREQYCKYFPLRCEHDKQIIQIAHEAGLRIAPDQWSSLLYGDMSHKPTMQSIIDKLQAPQDFQQSIAEFLIALGRTNDPAGLSKLQEPLQQISNIPADGGTISIDLCLQNLKSIELIIGSLVMFVRDRCRDQLSFGGVSHTKYKTSLSRDGKPRGLHVRGQSYNRGREEEMEERGTAMVDSNLKPRAVVNPTTRYRPPAEPQWQNQLPGGYYHQMAPYNDMPPVERVMPSQMQNMSPQGFYPQVPASPAMVTGMVHHPAVRVVPQSPVSPAEMMQRNHGDLALPLTNPYQSYYPSQQIGYHHPYYGYVQQYQQPHNPRNTPHQFEEQFMQANHPHSAVMNHTLHRPTVPDSRSYFTPNHSTVLSGASSQTHLSSVEPSEASRSRPQSVASLAASSVHLAELEEPDQQGLYEYCTSGEEADGVAAPNLASLRRRREELLDKIQSHQKPAEDHDGVIKTEISRDRLVDLARSLASSLSIGSQQDKLQTTFLNSMLSAANMPPLPDCPPGGASNVSWWSDREELSAFARERARVGLLYNSLSQPGVVTSHPDILTSVGDEATEMHSWTTWSGITPHCDETLSGDVTPWPGLKRSLSEVNSPDLDKSPIGRFSRSQSYAAGESESIIPWSDSPFISRFGPISRSSVVSSTAQRIHSDTSPTTSRLVSSPTQLPPVSAELDTDLPIKVPPHVSSRNVLTLPVTTVGPWKRPIPSPSLAHSKFTALPDDRLGFTVTNMDMEGSSSAMESEQLRQELKIVNSKIDKAEAQAACDGLTRLERRLEGNHSQSNS